MQISLTNDGSRAEQNETELEKADGVPAVCSTPLPLPLQQKSRILNQTYDILSKSNGTMAPEISRRTLPLPSKVSLVSGLCTFVKFQSSTEMSSNSGSTLLSNSRPEESARLSTDCLNTVSVANAASDTKNVECQDVAQPQQPQDVILPPPQHQDIPEASPQANEVADEIVAKNEIGASEESADVVKDSATPALELTAPDLREIDHSKVEMGNEASNLQTSKSSTAKSKRSSASSVSDKSKKNNSDMSELWAAVSKSVDYFSAKRNSTSRTFVASEKCDTELSQSSSSKRSRNKTSSETLPNVDHETEFEKSPSSKRQKNASKSSVVTRSSLNSRRSTENVDTVPGSANSQDVFLHPSIITNRSVKTTFSRTKSVNASQKSKVANDTSFSLVQKMLNANPEDVTFKSPLKKKMKKRDKASDSDFDELDLSMEALPKKPNFPAFHQFCNKRFYDFLIQKMKPKYGLKTNSEVVKVAEYIWKTVEEVEPMNNPDDYNAKVKEMRSVLARKQVVNTHYEFHRFSQSYLTPCFINRSVPMLKHRYPVVCPGELFGPILS